MRPLRLLLLLLNQIYLMRPLQAKEWVLRVVTPKVLRQGAKGGALTQNRALPKYRICASPA